MLQCSVCWSGLDYEKGAEATKRTELLDRELKNDQRPKQSQGLKKGLI